MRDFYQLTPSGRARRVRRVAVRALESYDLGVRTVRLLTNETNGVFRIDATDGQRYVLRVGRGGTIGHSSAQVRSEVEWLMALARDTDLRVRVLVPNAVGGMVTQVEVDGVPGARDCVLFRWLSGRPLDRALTRPNLVAYGTLAARLHEHAGTFRPSPEFSIVRYDRVFPFDQPVVLFDPALAISVSEAQRAVFKAATERVQGTIEILRRREPMRVLHGDLHRWNVLVDRAGVSAFDFEDLTWGWPVQDLAIALYYLAWEDGYPDLLAAFRTGYEGIRPWPDETGTEIDTFIAGRALVLANDVQLLEEPEYKVEASAWMARFEGRIRALLDS
jgi:Ser/Thr protein kinase RdoA (MazF antagonist)